MKFHHTKPGCRVYLHGALRFALALCALAPQVPAWSQEKAAGGTAEAAVTLPRGYGELSLGMSMDEAKAALAANSLFQYRGEPDVSLLPRPNESIIEVSGRSYIKRAFLQFYEGRLFVMIFAINEARMDHYSVFMTFSGKYGKPASLSPRESVWNDGSTRISIERPLAIKYLDMATFEAIREKSSAQENMEEYLRQDFLGGF